MPNERGRFSSKGFFAVLLFLSPGREKGAVAGFLLDPDFFGCPNGNVRDKSKEEENHGANQYCNFGMGIEVDH